MMFVTVDDSAWVENKHKHVTLCAQRNKGRGRRGSGRELKGLMAVR